jgi:MYXO-CTERM domain-containing protein
MNRVRGAVDVTGEAAMGVGSVFALVSTLALSSSAIAEFIGVSVEEITDFTGYTGVPEIDAEINAAYLTAGVRVFQVFLDFDGDDRLLQWGGWHDADGAAPMVIDVFGGTTESLFNAEYEPDHQQGFYAPSPFAVFDPDQRDAAFDSWLRFGLSSTPLRFGQFNDGTIPMFDAMDGVVQPIADNAGVAVDLGGLDGVVLDQTIPGRIPIAQLTFERSAGLEMQFSFTWDSLDQGGGEEFNEVAHFVIPVPTPGMLAILGLAAIVTGRRRRS